MSDPFRVDDVLRKLTGKYLHVFVVVLVIHFFWILTVAESYGVPCNFLVHAFDFDFAFIQIVALQDVWHLDPESNVFFVPCGIEAYQMIVTDRTDDTVFLWNKVPEPPVIRVDVPEDDTINSIRYM